MRCRTTNYLYAGHPCLRPYRESKCSLSAEKKEKKKRPQLISGYFGLGGSTKCDAHKLGGDLRPSDRVPDFRQGKTDTREKKKIRIRISKHNHYSGSKDFYFITIFSSLRSSPFLCYHYIHTHRHPPSNKLYAYSLHIQYPIPNIHPSPRRPIWIYRIDLSPPALTSLTAL